MRNNQPISQQEYEIAADATLMSTTDLQSHITYANAAFIEASGFAHEEIEGQPHNLVRHPDMPVEAFADMWATLKAGEPWTALVKNRRKNGDHYWVRANATPVVRDGQVSGYMSVRTKPARSEVEQAEALYRALREGRQTGLALRKGIWVPTGLRRLTSPFLTLGVRWRIRVALLLFCPLPLLAAWLSGVGGLALATLAGACGVALLGAAALLEQQIAGPLERLKAEALAVATGKSRNTAHAERLDEIGMTQRCLGQLGLVLRWLIDDVSQQVMNVQTAVNEIAQGNDDLSARTEQAATSVQQTASSMAQMTTTVQTNAETAAQANQLSGAASTAATQGGQAVSEVVATMQDITQSSKKIADIISVIDGIAFQTNILALNAAVEAARAGEQGRGFAVVAGEVRSLAQRSANAAKEIKSLIGASVEKVEAGASLVDDAGKTMDEIVHRVLRVTDLLSEISTSTAEQSNGIDQVGQAVGEIDRITQQNAALCEQTSAASASLKQQAQRLAEAVSVFR